MMAVTLKLDPNMFTISGVEVAGEVEHFRLRSKTVKWLF